MNADVLDPESTQTTKVVVGLLGKGHHVYMDNYYSSTDLLLELFPKECYVLGTCRKNRNFFTKGSNKSKTKKDR